MHKKERPIIAFQKASLNNIDAGDVIAYPRDNEGGEIFYAIPSFLIAGVRKCGSSALQNWLNQHPSLQTDSKEIHFFDWVADIEKEWKRYVIAPHFLIFLFLRSFQKAKYYCKEFFN